MSTFRKQNILLLILSTIVTTVLMLFLPSLLFLVLPETAFEIMESQSMFLFGHLSFLFLIAGCLYAVVGLIIGIKTETYKDALVKGVLVGIGLFFSFFIIGSLFNGAPIFAWAPSYFLLALPDIGIISGAALLLLFLRSRFKLNKYVLFALLFAVVVIVYVLLSGAFGNTYKNAPELDFMRAIPIYTGVKEQIVENSQFQLERDTAPGKERDYVGFGSFPAIGYSRESAIMVAEFCHQHLDLEKGNEHFDITETVVNLSVETALKSLVNKSFYTYFGVHSSRFDGMRDNEQPMDIAILPGKPDESYRDNSGHTVEITSAPIALDALVFIVHKDNPVSDLSSEQVRDIYSGIIKNWEDVGGENIKIKNYQRSDLSLTHRLFMEEMVMQGRTMIKPVEANDLSDKKAAAYQNYPESIGYCLRSFIENDGFRVNDGIKILSIDGVLPDEDRIRDGTYPYIVKHYAAIRKGEEDDTGGLFLDWILSDEGQACIRQAGYLPL